MRKEPSLKHFLFPVKKIMDIHVQAIVRDLTRNKDLIHLTYFDDLYAKYCTIVNRKFKLEVLNSLLLFLLFISIFGFRVEFELSGLRLSSLLSLKELILLGSSIVLIATSAYEVHGTLLYGVIQEGIKTLYPKQSTVYLLKYNKHYDAIIGITGSFGKHNNLSPFRYNMFPVAVLLLVVAVVIVGVVWMLTLLAVHTTIIMDIFNNPNLPIVWSWAILGLVILIDISTISTVMLLTVVKIKFVDLKLIGELSKLALTDKKAYAHKVDELLKTKTR